MKVPRQRRLAARRLLAKRGVRKPDAGNDTGHRRGFRAHLFCARRSAGEVCAIDVSSGLELGDHGVRWLLVQQLLDPAQRATQGLRIGPGAAQRQCRLERLSDGIRYGLQRFRCISLRSAALHCARCAID
ncbi:MAG TPA: hypothetical protein VHN14_21290 [Kofleriaceae bacterium]|nr:hypothetical protein [Kofleriaceae bacterium]